MPLGVFFFMQRPKKQPQRTLETARVFDETLISTADEEVAVVILSFFSCSV